MTTRKFQRRGMWGAPIVILAFLSQAIAPSSAFQSAPTRLVTRQHRITEAKQAPRFTEPRVNEKSATSLSATNPLLSAVGSPLGSLAVLAGVVLVHEAGHYLAARLLGVRVEEFSVGVGPKILGFKAFGDEFNLRAIPLGGYVRFPDNYNATLVDEMREAAMEQQAEQEVQSNEEKEDSIMSGLMNVFTFGGYERKRQQVEQRKLAQEEQEKSWLGNLFSTKAPEPEKPKETTSDFEIEYYDDPDLLQNRPWQERAVVLSGGVIFNFLLAFTIFFGEIHNGSGLPHPVFERGAVVTSIPRPDAASKGVLKPGDVIVSVDGSPLSVSESPNAAAAQRAITDFISKIRSTREGEALNLAVVRDSSPEPIDIVLKPKSTVDEFGNTGPQSIGAMLRPNYVRTTMIQSDKIGEAVMLAANGVTELTVETTNGLLAFFGTLMKGSGAPVGQSISGPIGLLRQGNEIVSTNDLTAIFTFAAALSINLAVVNSLPLPALDGGQLVFVLAEAVTGRKIDQRLQEGITSVAILFLLCLTVGTTVGDIESIFTGR